MAEPLRFEIFLDDKTLAGIGSARHSIESLQTVGQKVFDQLTLHIENLKSQIRDMDMQHIDTTESQKQLARLEEQAEKLKNQLTELQQQGKQPVIADSAVEDPAPKINNLRTSISQVARELPSLAMGPQMFFLAISNNIPMVQDALAQVRKENERLTASGQKATPVWKQLAMSIVSWQTALALAVTLLVMYGKEIVDWTTSLFKANQSMAETIETMDEFKEAVNEGSSSVIAKLMQMSEEWKALGNDIQAQEQYIVSMKSRMDELGVSITNVTDANTVFIEQTDRFIQSLVQRSKATATLKIMEDEVQKAMELYTKYQEEPSTMTYRTYSGMPFMGKWETITTENPNKEKLKKEYEDQIRVVEELAAKANDFRTAEEDILQSLGLQSVKSYAEGSIAEIEAAIRLKQDALKQVTNRDDYKKIEAEIKALEKQRDAITGQTKKKTTRKSGYDAEAELLAVQRDNQQREIDLMAEGGEKKRAQARQDYQLLIDEITAQEKKMREAQKGTLTTEQTESFTKARTQAEQLYQKQLNDIAEEELKDNQDKLDKLYEQYRTFEGKRVALEEQYNKDIELLESAMSQAESQGDTAEVEKIRQTIEARTEAYKEGLQDLQSDMLKTSDFYNSLYADYSERSYAALKEAVDRAKEVLQNAVSDGEGISIRIPVVAEDGTESYREVKLTIEEFDKLNRRLRQMSRQLENDNPYQALKDAYDELTEALEKGDQSKIDNALSKLTDKAATVMKDIRSLGNSIGTIFGDKVADAIGEATNALDNFVQIASSIVEIKSGNIFSGIVGIFQGIANFFSSSSSSSFDLEESIRAMIIGAKEYNQQLRAQNEELAAQRNLIAGILDDAEQLSWLIENGFVGGDSTVSVFESSVKQMEAYKESLRQAQTDYESIRDMMNGMKISAVGNTEASAFWKVLGTEITPETTKEVLDLAAAQGKLPEGLKEYYDQWKATGEEIDELIGKIEDMKESMREMVVGTSFDSFLSSSLDVIKGDMDDLASYTQETLQNAVLNAFMYQRLATVLEPLYNELADAFIDGTADSDFIRDWKRRFENEMMTASEALKDMQEATGVTISESTTQSAQTGAFTAMTQEQGSKLEGLFTSVQDNTVSIRKLMEELRKDKQTDTKYLAEIAQNTSYCKLLRDILDLMERIERNGIKI